MAITDLIQQNQALAVLAFIYLTVTLINGINKFIVWLFKKIFGGKSNTSPGVTKAPLPQPQGGTSNEMAKNITSFLPQDNGLKAKLKRRNQDGQM